MEDHLSKKRRKYDSALKRYREKHQAMLIAQENYKKNEENKSLSKAQLDLSNQIVQVKKDEYNLSKQDYAVEFRDFNETQRDHFDSKIIKWAKKGEELYHQKLKLLKELATQFSKLMNDTIGKLNYSVTRFSDVTKQVDFKKDAILLVQKYKTGDVPPLELQFIDMDYNQYSSTLARKDHSDDTSDDDTSEFSSSNDSIDAAAPIKTQIHSTSNSSVYNSSFSHDNRSEPIRSTPQNVKLRNTGTTVNPDAKFSIQKSPKIFKSSTPWKNSADPHAKPTEKQPSLYQRRGRNSTRQPQNSRRSRSVTDMISDVFRSSLRLKSKNDKSDGKDCRDRSPSNSQIVTSRQSISDFDSDTDVNQSKEAINRFAPDIVSTPADAVADWKRQMSRPDYDENDRQYLTMNLSNTPNSQNANSQSEEIYQEVYVGSCVSNHNFDSEDPSNNYLSFQAGDQFYIVKMDDGSGWLYVDTIDQTSRGFVPSSYMKICEYDNLNEAVV